MLTNVDPSMFTRTISNIVESPANNRGCSGGFRAQGITANVRSGTYKITLIKAQSSGKYQVRMDNGIFTVEPGHVMDNTYYLKRNSDSITEFTLVEINQIDFDIGGEVVSSIIGNENDFMADYDSKNFCEYIVSSPLSSASSNIRQYTVNYQLFEADEAGGCNYPNQPVKTTQGRTSASKQIVVQKEEQAYQQASDVAQQFQRQNYPQVRVIAYQVINQRNGDLPNAQAVYYSAASLILQGQKERNDPQLYAQDVQGYLSLFFDRPGQAVQEPYKQEEVGKPEFQKIAAYMCKIDASYGGRHQNNKYCSDK